MLRAQQRTAIPRPPAPGAEGPVKVAWLGQSQSEWCWAACAQMVLWYYGSRQVRQCDFADWLFGQRACCKHPSSSLCNWPCRIEDVSSIYSRWNLQSSLHKAVSFEILEREIKDRRPVEVGYLWLGGDSGHLALVVDTTSFKNKKHVKVHDPFYGKGMVEFSALERAYGLGTWHATWIGIKR